MAVAGLARGQAKGGEDGEGVITHVYILLFDGHDDQGCSMKRPERWVKPPIVTGALQALVSNEVYETAGGVKGG